jgi:hypothetical protein
MGSRAKGRHSFILSRQRRDFHEILMSLGMNIIVAFGFWLEWKESKPK